MDGLRGLVKMSLDAPIDALDAFLVRVPLPNVLHVFGKRITEREFVIVRVTSGRHSGTGYGLARGLDFSPLVLKNLAPLVLHQPVGSIRAIWDAARHSVRMIGEQGYFARALSALDIALWDLMGHVLDIPIWRLLGGKSSSVPCAAICGYYRDEDSVSAIREEAERLVQAGYTRFKIPFGADPVLDNQRLQALRDVVGPEALIGLDASAAYNTIAEATRAWQQVERFKPAFLEDPFSAAEWELSIRMARETTIPVAFGESVSSPSAIQRLGQTEGVSILRPDATLQLGVTGYLQAVAPALEHHKPVFPHYYPDVHGTLVGGLGGWMIEESPMEADTVGFRQLRSAQPIISNGTWQLSEQAGFGFVLDEDVLQRFRC